MRTFSFCVLMLAACVAQSGDSPPGTPPGIGDAQRIALNSLSPSWLADGQLTTDALTSTNAAAMGSTEHARTVLAYAVTCALGDDQTVSYTVDGTVYSATGEMGIAPGWPSGPLSTTEAAWISACLLGRLNLTSTIVVISARGDHAGLATDSAERADYRIEEGAFWGNTFVDRGSITGYACNGVDQAANDSYGDLPYRQCAQWDGVTDSNMTPCGLHYAGLCSSACASGPPYAGCSFQGGTPSSAVITTYLYGTPP